MKRKYLDDIGVKERHDLWNKDDKRQKKWKKQRRKYGFDERETWCLESAFYCWLYERLMFYREKAPVDLSYRKFDFKGKEYTQGELIDIMLERLRLCLTDDGYNCLVGEQYDQITEIAQIWAIVLPAMWW